MNIKRAKAEIKDAIEAYLQKDSYGEYQIPVIRQRPILLIGPPGIGKTQIMEQISRECGIGLVSYTITHHTRQSAIGLPFIKEKQYGNQTYSVTEYTMSEIIGAVYEKIEKTKNSEGILFIDEINCVSETLAPTMLQFLQCKMFGNQQIPKGWVIVAAGNPPEYNKSVREFDLVTLDRIRKIDVEENFEVWKEYAYKASIHPAIISYLEMRRTHFYRIETTIDGKAFVTARGWEDLSELLEVYEALGKTIDQQVVFQYVQHLKIAKDFANYWELYHKYKKDYGFEDILKGNYHKSVLEKLKFASLDERLNVVGLLIGKLEELFKRYRLYEQYLDELYDWLKAYKDSQDFQGVLQAAEQEYEAGRLAERFTRIENRLHQDVIKTLNGYLLKLKSEGLSGAVGFDYIKGLFSKEQEVLDNLSETCGKALDYGFDFLEEAFSPGQEMVMFMTELNSSYNASWFIKEHGNDRYFKYNKGLLLDERHQEIIEHLEQNL